MIKKIILPVLTLFMVSAAVASAFDVGAQEEFIKELDGEMESEKWQARSEAAMVKAVSDFRGWLRSGYVEDERLAAMHDSLCKAMKDTEEHKDEWQFWMSRWMYSGYFSSQGKYAESLKIGKDLLAQIPNGKLAVKENNLCRALLASFEMELSMEEAIKLSTALSAALCGEEDYARELAKTIPASYGDMVNAIIRSKKKGM